RAADTRGDRPRLRHPRRVGDRRGSGGRRAPLPPHRARHHPRDARHSLGTGLIAPVPPTGLKLLHVAAEVFPLVKTGGLADVAGALTPALESAGAEVRLLLQGLPP